jgi:beta-glucosidase
LPSIQKRCLKALKEAGKKVIFVNCSGSAIALLDETKSCDAILQAWYGGESGGQAVADVLFGDYNPSGKLPISFYKDSEKLGDFEDYSMKGRTYRYTTDVLFPFGFGLSYTNFNIENAEFNKTSINKNESVQLSIPVSNTGDYDGTEIVQVYVRKVNDTEDAPLKTLKGYKRLEVKAGQTKNAVVNLPSTAFEFYDWDTLTMNVTAGEYEVYYGTSSDAKNLKTKKVTIQ